MNLGKSIKVACAMTEMSQDELSEETGIDSGTISRYVRGKSACNTRTMITIADALNMSVSEFIALGE
jgi:transcriptional regulator with XRE-family HTH domain|tara:strand:- start:154 stop:354 length:201 start_codon:yes stop_codon:yes gene_type:complete